MTSITKSTVVVAAFAAFSAQAGTPSTKVVEPVAPVIEEESGALFDSLGASISAGWDSDYIFRGVQFNRNLVWAGLDLGIPLGGIASLDIGTWYGVSADRTGVFGPNPSGNQMTELDAYAWLNFDLGAVDLGVGYTHYHYFNDIGAVTENINEVGVTLGTEVAGFAVGLGGYYDDATDGFYFELPVSYSIPVASWLNVVPGALISYANDYYGVSSFNHANFSLAFEVALTETASLSPYIAYNLPLEDLSDAGEGERFFGGVALSVSF